MLVSPSYLAAPLKAKSVAERLMPVKVDIYFATLVGIKVHTAVTLSTVPASYASLLPPKQKGGYIAIPLPES